MPEGNSSVRQRHVKFSTAASVLLQLFPFGGVGQDRLRDMDPHCSVGLHRWYLARKSCAKHVSLGFKL